MATTSLSARRFHSLEPLEARIAPALLTVGANLLGGSNPTTGETSSGGNAVTLIKVLSGLAIAWYDGAHITEISFAPNTTLDLTGDVQGDVVGNLLATGRLSDSDHNSANGEDGNILLANNLLGLTTHQLGPERGDVRNIVSGGLITNVNVNGHLQGVYAGDGVFQPGSVLLSSGSVHSPVGHIVNPIDPASDTSFTFQRATSQLLGGAYVNKLTVAIAQNLQVFAGSGSPQSVVSTGLGVGGGGIANVHILSALVSAGSAGTASSYALMAGAGGDGRLGGGAGGAIFNVLEDTSTSMVQITGGAGGASTAGPGGAGGGIHDIDLQGDSASYTILGGKGGTGKPGGAGGGLLHANFAGKKPNSGIIVTGDFNGDFLDDVLVVDDNTGDMVISAASNNGTVFTQLPQYQDAVTHQNITRISGNGTTPSDAVAVDVTNDGLLDIVVAYKNSNKLTIFVNQGGGSFYNPTTHKFVSTDVALTYSPEHLAAGSFGGSAAQDLVVTETTGGAAAAHLLIGDDNGAFLTNSVSAHFTSSITDLVTAKTSGGDIVFAGTVTGQIYALTAPGTITAPLTSNSTLSIAGGVATLDANSTGDTLVAVSASGRLVDFYNISNGGTLTFSGALDLKTISGRVVSAHFVNTGVGTQGDALGVLSTAGGGSQFGLYMPNLGSSTATYVQTRQVQTTTALKNFAVAYDYSHPDHLVSSYGFAALGGSLNQFSYSVEVGNPTAYTIPFSGKKVAVTSGDGGDGLTTATGGTAGAIAGINVESTDISVFGGQGGASAAGTAGAGGSISNPTSFVSFSGLNLLPVLAADQHLSVLGGNGGTNTSTAATAAGGAGGSLVGLSLQLATGNLDVNAGLGGLGHGGAGGAGGNINGLNITSFDGNLSVSAGDGAEALSGNTRGGLGGSITNLTYKLSLLPVVEALESGYSVTLASGKGGQATQGLGGNGGAVSGISLNLDPSDTTSGVKDSTVRIAVTTGAGGLGLNGGAGGSIGRFSSVSTFDQVKEKGTVEINYVVLNMTAGVGGQGTAGTGGAGGSILLTGSAATQGITNYDPDAAEHTQTPYVVTAGAGGTGTVRGGAGGSIAGLVVQNALGPENSLVSDTQLHGATITAGAGGAGGSSDGGSGGSISSLQLAPKYAVIVDPITANRGALAITAGVGGTGLRGGVGGSVSLSYLADVNSDISIVAGAGGNGVNAGGRGGTLSSLNVNSPEISLNRTFAMLAGAGGSASAVAGFGGPGGGIGGITQTKDINSVIGLIQAGSGGAAAQGTGGAGGAISGISAVGFLGSPVAQGAFDSNGNPQGVFAGRGGSGSVAAGAAGSVANILARQIAAIGAAYDASAHTFGVASSVSAVRADIIGYDVNHNGVFDYVVAGGTTPSHDQPRDGFILAKAISAINGTALFRFTS